MKTSNRSIGLALSQATLYPPLLGNAPAVVGFTTELAPGEDIEFSLVANGAPGTPTKVELRPGSSAGGTLWVQPGFVADHAGTWPVQLMLQASRQGEVIDTATLWLLDTRLMQVHSVKGEMFPNPAYVSEADTVQVLVRPKFYDSAGLELPRDEVPWSLSLPDQTPGLEVDGNIVHVAPGTAPGEAKVLIEGPSGIAQTIPLALLPALDIGLVVDPHDLYPPLRGDFGMVFIRTSLPVHANPQFSYELNGEGGFHDGLYLQGSTNYWVLLVGRAFLQSYQGPWPAEITIRAVLGGQLAGQSRMYLHDTRTMVCKRVDIEFNPSDTVTIPATDFIRVFAGPRFYDAQDVRLPAVELDWGMTMDNGPLPGIVQTQQVIEIYPEARPTYCRMTLQGPNGLRASKVLTVS